MALNQLREEAFASFALQRARPLQGSDDLINIVLFLTAIGTNVFVPSDK